jgi:hypothetical protein
MAEASFTVSEWCSARKISRSKFYELKQQGLAPRLHHAGNKQLISPESDRDWIRQREAEAAEPCASTEATAA